MTANKKKHPQASGRRRPPARRPARRPRSGAYTAITAVVAMILAIVVFSIYRHVGAATGVVSASSAAEHVEHVPASVLHTVGAGSGVSLLPVALPAATPANTQGGKPVVLYIGAEYCPYCATQRWPVIVALSRFGSFTNLKGMESASGDVYPKTQTFTFHGATYTSDFLTLQAVETNTNQPSLTGLGYTSLDQPTAAQQALLVLYDRAPYTDEAGAIPFLLIGNRFVSVGASYDPALLQGKTRDQIASALSDPTSPIAQSVDGSANAITAAICAVTHNQPSTVCTDPAVVALATRMAA